MQETNPIVGVPWRNPKELMLLFEYGTLYYTFVCVFCSGKVRFIRGIVESKAHTLSLHEYFQPKSNTKLREK